MFDKEAIQAIQQSAGIDDAASAVMEALNGTRGLFTLPSDFKVHDLESVLLHRRRARGTMNTTSIADFAAYTKEAKQAGATVFVDVDQMKASAVLNLGTTDEPGHGDDRAILTAKKTAAYQAMRKVAQGMAMSQQTVAEFCEDWSGFISYYKESDVVAPGRAIAAIRKITVEAMRKVEASEGQLSASRGMLESVTASSSEPLPTHLYFACVPYQELELRTFVLRLGVITGDKPAITLRVVNVEQHEEEMARELAGLVKAAMGNAMPVLLGGYTC